MNITLFLAVSQLKKKKLRTISTLVMIGISTALTTLVFNLLVSGNTMLRDLLGHNYSGYMKTYQTLLLIPAIIFLVIILVMFVVIISNVFRVSTGERLMEFGTLKSVGSTGRQILETVLYEAVILSAIGIPVGILSGIGLTYVGVGIVNIELEELNSLTNMMINKFTMSLDVVIDWKVILLSAIISFLTVLYCAYRPGKIAGKKSAISCIRQNEENRLDILEKDKSKDILGRGKIEFSLAKINVNRNRKQTKSAITVLSISIILFISLSGVKDIADRAKEYLNPDMKQTVIVDYVSNYDKTLNTKTNRYDVKFSNPIDEKTADKIAKELKAYDDNEFFYMGNDYDTYYAMFPEKNITDEMKAALEYQKISVDETCEFSVEVISVGDETYDMLCEKADVKEGANILLNAYCYNYNGNEKKITPWKGNIEKLNLELADGKPTEIKVDGILGKDEIPDELFYLNTNTVRIVVKNATVRGYSWYSSPDDVEGYMDYANKVMEKYYKTDKNDNYMETGYSTRVYMVDDYAKVMNIAIMVACIFLYSFVIMLAVVGIINVVSSISTSITVRQREFAVLKSIGMTQKELEKMLTAESILCSGKALLYGLPVGIAVVLLCNYAMIKIMPIGMDIPVKAIIIVFVCAFVIIFSTIRVALRRMKKQSIIETIRM